MTYVRRETVIHPLECSIQHLDKVHKIEAIINLLLKAQEAVLSAVVHRATYEAVVRRAQILREVVVQVDQIQEVTTNFTT